MTADYISHNFSLPSSPKIIDHIPYHDDSMEGTNQILQETLNILKSLTHLSIPSIVDLTKHLVKSYEYILEFYMRIENGHK